MSKRMTIVAAAALAGVLCLGGDADAREAAWIGKVSTQLKYKIFDEGGRVVAKQRDKFSVEDQAMDTLQSTRVRFDFGGDGLIELAGEFVDPSDKKSKVSTYETFAQDFQETYPHFTWQAPGDAFKKPTIGATPITVQRVEPKGKIRVTNKFNKVKLKVVYAVEGTIGGEGKYAGNTFKGKFTVKFKGTRAD